MDRSSLPPGSAPLAGAGSSAATVSAVGSAATSSATGASGDHRARRLARASPAGSIVGSSIGAPRPIEAEGRWLCLAAGALGNSSGSRVSSASGSITPAARRPSFAGAAEGAMARPQIRVRAIIANGTRRRIRRSSRRRQPHCRVTPGLGRVNGSDSPSAGMWTRAAAGRRQGEMTDAMLSARSVHRVSAPLAQLDRASGYGPGGWRFESSRARFFCP